MARLSVGHRFERLVVEAEDRSGSRLLWRCRCDCGTVKLAAFHDLNSGRVRSCGCLQRELSTQRLRLIKRKAPRQWVPEIWVWQRMKDRCSNDNAPQYQDYGGRGVRVCERWVQSFDNFLADVGRRPSPRHTLDRINVHGHYEPGNVRWATRDLQARNTRASVCALSVILIRFIKRRSPRTRNEDIGHAFGLQKSAVSKIYLHRVTRDAFGVLGEDLGW